MSGFLFKTASTALALVLSVGAAGSMAASVSISGGSSADVGGWQIAPGSGVTLTGVSFDSDTNTLLIQNKSETFSSGAGELISFTQVDADAAPSIEIATASIQNSTGFDWTGFEFSVTGSALFDGVGNVFVPPFSTGVNYTSVTLSPDHSLLTYTGTQSNGAAANWGSSNSGDDLLIDATPSSEAPFADFSLEESPVYVAAGPVVPTPLAAWLSLAGLLVVGLMPVARKMATVRA